MKLKSLGPSNWVDFARSLILLGLLLGAGMIAAGNSQWLQITDHERAIAAINQVIQVASSEQTKALQAVAAAQQQLSQDLATELALYRINSLDTQITFLKIKVQQGEASESEKIILPTLERQLRELKRRIE